MINWKHLAATTGYKSLKAAYIHDVQESAKRKRPMRDKVEFLRKFQWVINRAKHYAHHTGESMEAILNEWEEKRTCWWLNYYQESGQPKFHSKSTKPMGVRGIHEHYNHMYRHDPARGRLRLREYISRIKGEKIKPRWNTARKKRGY